MKIRLEDVIDLEYLIHADEEPGSREDALKLAERDREIYSRSKVSGGNDRELLFSWLFSRREQCEEPLPGHAVSKAISLTRYVSILGGGLMGMTASWSFLAYHGARPINVALYLFLFVGLPLMLTFTAALFRLDKKREIPFFHILLSSLSFKLIPRLLGQTKAPFKFVLELFKGSKGAYHGVLFWLFFKLTSVFSFSFSAGVLGASFLKVLVSDMAFGWQSTLITKSSHVYDMVSAAAVPWKWFVPGELAHPGLKQIEGSRIILKEGIEVLATQDLASWWPFICLAVLTYAVIPRIGLIAAGKIIMNRNLQQLDFSHPRFRQLILRMQSPVLEIDDEEDSEDHTRDSGIEAVKLVLPPAVGSKYEGKGSPAVILASKSVYSEAALDQAAQYIRQYMFLDTTDIHSITFDFEADRSVFSVVGASDADQVFLLQEAWQPPIRGILYYLKQVRNILPENMSLYVLLTNDAGQKRLSIDKTDMNAQIWEKAVYGLKSPGIKTKRML